MAINIVQQPTYPNGTFTHLVYTISSSLSGQPQYQYLMDVNQGGETLTRIKQFPNPSGVGIFDPSRILSDLIGYDNSWKITAEYTPVLSYQDFSIKFGEEYGTSISSSVTVYDGNGNPGNPAVTGTTTSVFPGTVDPNNGSSYNFISSSIALSDVPTTGQYIGGEDYYTMAFMNTGSVDLDVTVDYNPGAAYTYTIPADGAIRSVPISGKNIGISGWSEAIVSYNGTQWEFDLAEECNYDRVRFAFINDYGFWDYYAFNLPVSKVTTINRQSLRRPQVNYGSSISQYSSTKRGTDYYNTQYVDNISVTTPFVDQTEADWLRQMIESPNVFIQEDEVFKPIVITNASFTHNTNKKSQKTYQIQISYQLANNRIGR